MITNYTTRTDDRVHAGIWAPFFFQLGRQKPKKKEKSQKKIPWKIEVFCKKNSKKVKKNYQKTRENPPQKVKKEKKFP